MQRLIIDTPERAKQEANEWCKESWKIVGVYFGSVRGMANPTRYLPDDISPDGTITSPRIAIVIERETN